MTTCEGCKDRYLTCPACDEPCANIPSCEEAHADCQGEVADDDLVHSWCDDRRGVCGCGARLHVEVDDGWARLYEDAEDGEPGPGEVAP